MFSSKAKKLAALAVLTALPTQVNAQAVTAYGFSLNFPTTWLDGTPLPVSDIENGRLEYGTCIGNTNIFGTILGTLTATPANPQVSMPQQVNGTEICMRTMVRTKRKFLRINYTLPVTYTDLTPIGIGEIIQYRLEYGTANGGVFGTSIGNLYPPPSAGQVDSPVLPDGRYCVRGFTIAQKIGQAPSPEQLPENTNSNCEYYVPVESLYKYAIVVRFIVGSTHPSTPIQLRVTPP